MQKGGNKQELDLRTRLTPNLECTNEYMHYVNYSRLPNSRTPELEPFREIEQRANKVVFDSPGRVDFAIGLMNSVIRASEVF